MPVSPDDDTDKPRTDGGSTADNSESQDATKNRTSHRRGYVTRTGATARIAFAALLMGVTTTILVVEQSWPTLVLFLVSLPFAYFLLDCAIRRSCPVNAMVRIEGKERRNRR